MDRLPTAGWTPSPVAWDPAAGSWLTQDSTYATATPQRTWPGGVSRAGGATRGPGDLGRTSLPTARTAWRKQTWSTKLDAEFSRPPNWPQSVQLGTHSPPSLALWRLPAPLTRTEPAGPPASTRRGSSPAGQGSDFRQNVPGDDPPLGPGATSECQNSRPAGPRPGPIKYYNTSWPGLPGRNLQATLGLSRRPSGASSEKLPITKGRRHVLGSPALATLEFDATVANFATRRWQTGARVM